MMVRVMKSDMNHVINNISMTAHYSTIFRELVEVYDPDKYMTLDEALQPFSNKKPTCKIPGTMDKPNEKVRYSDYIIPLFYTSALCKDEKSHHVIKELLGMILKNNGHFYRPEWMCKQMADTMGDLTFYDYRRYYWGYTNLTAEEKDKVNKMYAQYLSIC